MKLYYSPGACSFAPHVALVEAGLPFEPVKVDIHNHTLADGTDYYGINPKGYVPLLELDDGSRLSEVAVILQYIADRKPGTLAPAFGTHERYKLMEWLNFIATEVHKQFGPLWYPDTPEATKDGAPMSCAIRSADWPSPSSATWTTSIRRRWRDRLRIRSWATERLNLPVPRRPPLPPTRRRQILSRCRFRNCRARWGSIAASRMDRSGGSSFETAS